jgi:GWxTD domain-containing protein
MDVRGDARPVVGGGLVRGGEGKRKLLTRCRSTIFQETRWGVMIRFRKYILSVLAIVAVTGVCRPAVAREIVGRGDFTFYLDSAAFRGKDGRVLQQFYVRIPNNEINFKQHVDGYTAKLRVSIELRDPEGNPVIQDSEERGFKEDVKAHADNSLYFQTLIKSYYMEPGVYLLSYAIEDLEAQKRTVLGVMKNKFNTAFVRNSRIEIPVIPDDAPSFSLPRFVWSIDNVDGRTVYHPNPPRMYGLYKDTLEVYVELYLPAHMAEAPTFEFKSYVMDAEGETMAGRTLSLPNPDSPGGEGGLRTYPIVIREDLAKFPAGAYTLQFSFGLERNILSRVRAGAFSVAWDIRTWEVPRRSYMAEARFLLGDTEYAAFQQMSFGEQERTLDELWRAEDPAPETGINESFEQFLERLAYVNTRFAEHTREAIFTDRGQIYMRWGPPDDFIEDVIPVNRETLSEAFALVENKFHPVNYSTHGVKTYTNAIRPPVIDHRRMSQVGEGGNTSFPFELWIYNDTGAPILRRDKLIDPDVGTRYLFVDREGYGVYKLETSTKISDK